MMKIINFTTFRNRKCCLQIFRSFLYINWKNKQNKQNEVFWDFNLQPFQHKRKEADCKFNYWKSFLELWTIITLFPMYLNDVYCKLPKAKSLVRNFQDDSSSYCTIRHRGLLWRRIYPESTFLEVKVTNNNKEATVSMKNKRFTSNLFKSCRVVEKSGGKVALHFCISNFFLIMNFQGCRTDLELWSGGSFVNTEFLMSLLSKIDFLQISQLVLHWYVIDIIFLLIVNDIVKILDIHPEVVKDFPQESHF